MPPKDAIWQLYETLKGEDGKLVGYLTNKTNKCVWCSPCLDKYAALKRSAEAANIGCHEPGPSQIRSKAMLRAEAKKSELAPLATNWKEKSLLLFTNGVLSGVVPICSKVETMRSHSRDCPNTTTTQKSSIPGLCPSTSGQENTAPTASQVSTSSVSSEPPAKRVRTEPPAAWTESRQEEFGGDVLNLFTVCNIPFNIADNIELELFCAKWIPGSKVPERRALSGTYLDSAVETAHSKTREAVEGKYATGQSDGWKNVAKTSVITSMMNVERQVHLVETHDMTNKPKTGAQHAELIEADIRLIRDKFGADPIGWVTDDGPDGKAARRILSALYPWLFTTVCWGHQSQLLAGDYLKFPSFSQTITDAIKVVRWFTSHAGALDLFNDAQLWAARRTSPLALLLPVVTRWGSHLQCVGRLWFVKGSMRACILRNRDRLYEIAESSQAENAYQTGVEVVGIVDSEDFWNRLARVREHLTPIAIATNVLQTNHTRLDHVLMTLANLYWVYDKDSVEPDVRDHMLSRLELRWKKGAGKEQEAFILVLFLNPYVRGYCFNQETINGADILAIASRLFKRFFGCDPDTSFTSALLDYSQRRAEFSDSRMQLAYHMARAEQDGIDPDLVQIWTLCNRSNDPPETMASTGRNGLVKLAVRLLSIIANSAGVERAFSDFGITHSKRRNRLSVEKVHKTSIVRMARRREHVELGLVPNRRLKRKLGFTDSPDSEAITTPTRTTTSSTVPGMPAPLTSSARMPIESDDEDSDGAALSDSLRTITQMAETSFSELLDDSSDEEPNFEELSVSGSGPLVLTQQSISLASTSTQQPRRRNRHAAPVACQVLLKDLFLFPSPPKDPDPPPEDPSPPTTSDDATAQVDDSETGASPTPGSSRGGESQPQPATPIPSSSPPSSSQTNSAGKEPENNLQLTLLQRFRFIWKGGIASYRREMQLCELLQPEGPA